MSRAGWRRWVRWRSLVLVLLAGVLGLNLVAYFHAYRMTHFAQDGPKTSSPERLSAWEQVLVLLRGVRIPRPLNTYTPASQRLAYRTEWLGSRPGQRLEAWHLEGAGPVVLMFHGHAVSKRVMLTEARHFHELGATVLLVDFRGSGGSDGSDTTLGWRESEDVLESYRWAATNHLGRPLVLYGQSMGAAAVLRAVAVHGLRPAAVMVEAPFARLLTTVAHRFQAMGLPATPLDRLLLFWGGLQHGFNAFELNPIEYAREVRCPSLVLGGARDPWVYPEELRELAAAMGGASQLHILPGAGHGGYVHTHPEQYRDLVGQWWHTALAGR